MAARQDGKNEDIIRFASSKYIKCNFEKKLSYFDNAVKKQLVRIMQNER